MAPKGVPAPVKEHQFHPKRKWRFDFAWPERMVAVEVDGGQWKKWGGRHNRDSDREKLNAAAALGWRVLRYSGAMLNDPASVVEQIVEALGA
jgi:very-short-patch-repair endonuclease